MCAPKAGDFITHAILLELSSRTVGAMAPSFVDLFCGAGGLTQGLVDWTKYQRLGLTKLGDVLAAYRSYRTLTLGLPPLNLSNKEATAILGGLGFKVQTLDYPQSVPLDHAGGRTVNNAIKAASKSAVAAAAAGNGGSAQ